MRRTSLKPRGAVSGEQARPIAPPTREEFAAECEALTSALVETLGADLRAETETAAREVVVPPARSRAASGKPTEPDSILYPGAMEFVPPYVLIRKMIAEAEGRSAEVVTISPRLLELLLRCILNHVDFDEQQYQLCNPDVAVAIKQGKIQSGREHFVVTGYFEGRSGGVPVDETWYLARNPDVAAAKRAGQFDSAAAQYRLSGAGEWRVPNPRSEGAIRTWKEILER